MRPEQLIEAIRRLIDPEIAIAGWRPLEGGSSARCFSVELAGRRVVVKRADDAGMTALSVEAEFRLLEDASRIGIAPVPIGFDRDSGLLLCELVEAPMWVRGDFAQPSKLARLAAGLRNLHTLPTGVRPYEPLRFAETYCAACAAPARGRADTLRRELVACAGFLDRLHDAAVVCHNDLHASNILGTADPVFIDFEYAAAAPPIVDLASVIAMNGLDAPQSESLVAAYYDGMPIPFDRETLARAVRMHEVLADLWGLARGPAGEVALRSIRV